MSSSSLRSASPRAGRGPRIIHSRRRLLKHVARPSRCDVLVRFLRFVGIRGVYVCTKCCIVYRKVRTPRLRRFRRTLTYLTNSVFSKAVFEIKKN